MKMNPRGIAGRYRHFLALEAGFFPLTVWMAAAQPSVFPILPLFAVLYALLALVCILLPGKWRVPAAIAGAVLLVGLALRVLPVREADILLLIPIMYAVLLFVSLPAEKESSPSMVTLYIPSR